MSLRGGQYDWLDLEHYSDNPIFNTKAVVQQTGIPGPTLRAWERRYDILSPERANNITVYIQNAISRRFGGSRNASTRVCRLNRL